jgi:uncharacterized protein (TIGR02117 family)
MLLRPRVCLFAVSLLLLQACAAESTRSARLQDLGYESTIYIASHGWHTGIVLRTRDVPERIWPEIRDFAGSEHVEVGWGDRDYYQAPDSNWVLALKAAFWSKGSVLHVAGFDGTPQAFFPESEIVEVPVTESALRGLVAFISATHLREESAKGTPTGPGLYGQSRFYPARGRFHIFRTCNTWVLEALEAAGLAVRPRLTITAGGVMSQVEDLPGARRLAPRAAGSGAATKPEN